MSLRTTVRIGFAALVLTLGGCAAEPPVDGAAVPPSCDLVCRFMRLLDLDQPSPTPAPVTPPVRLHAKAATHASVAKVARRKPMPPLRPTLAVVPVAVRVPPPAVPFQPPPVPALAVVPEETTDVMPGSPGITPPWFEPWSGPRAP